MTAVRNIIACIQLVHFSFRGNGSVSDQKELQANASGDLKGVEVKYSPYVSADLTREEDL